MPAIFIILAVGIIVGSWMYAGTVPALIYYFHFKPTRIAIKAA
jgi:Na+/H+ antiporter NhaC